MGLEVNHGQWHGCGAFRKAVGQGLEKVKGVSIVSEAVGLGLKVGLGQGHGHGAAGKAVGQGWERSQGCRTRVGDRPQGRDNAVGYGLETGQGWWQSCARPSAHAASPQLRDRCHPPVAGERLRAAAVACLPWLPGGQLRGDARAPGGPGHGERGAVGGGREGGRVGRG